MNLTLTIRWLFCLTTMLCLTGCAWTPARLNLAYSPVPGKKSPLSTVKPMSIALEVQDQRDPTERDRVGDKKNGWGMVTAKALAKKELTAVIYDALKTEFENNGHKVVDSKTEHPAVNITILLKKYWSDFNIHFWDVEMVGTVNSEVGISNPRNNSVIFSKSINGTFRESRQIALDSAFESVLNGALAEFVRNFSYDMGIISALQESESK